MAKRARPAAARKPVKKPAKPPRATSRAKAAKPKQLKKKPARAKAAAPAVVARPRPAPPPLPPPPLPPPPDPGRKAVELFEQGFSALQQRDYARAAEILASLVTSYPEEKELHERARVFLAICERQAAAAPQPQTLEERICAATLAINRGETAQAIGMLGDLVREHPDHDHIHYLLAIAHSAAGHGGDAVAHLRRAIELRPSNRVLAGQDADFDVLRDDPAFHALMDGNP